MKTASASAALWGQRASAASADYVKGASNTVKDPTTLAVAAQSALLAGFNAAISSGRWARNLQAKGKSGWVASIVQKGGSNYQTGVGTQVAQTAYATNSGKYDSARAAASSVARGPRGTAGNLARVAAVVNAELAVKNGK